MKRTGPDTRVVAEQVDCSLLGMTGGVWRVGPRRIVVTPVKSWGPWLNIGGPFLLSSQPWKGYR